MVLSWSKCRGQEPIVKGQFLLKDIVWIYNYPKTLAPHKNTYSILQKLSSITNGGYLSWKITKNDSILKILHVYSVIAKPSKTTGLFKCQWQQDSEDQSYVISGSNLETDRWRIWVEARRTLPANGKAIRRNARISQPRKSRLQFTIKAQSTNLYPFVLKSCTSLVIITLSIVDIVDHELFWIWYRIFAVRPLGW